MSEFQASQVSEFLGFEGSGNKRLGVPYLWFGDLNKIHVQ